VRRFAKPIGKLTIADRDLPVVVAVEAAKQLEKNSASAEAKRLVGWAVDHGCGQTDERLAAKVSTMVRTLLTASHRA
jgi:hypothetical protein